MNKNKKLLDEFTKYCNENPEQRFWQALRNWVGVNYIFTSRTMGFKPDYEDTFYWEEKDK